jgi:cytochrome c-type biogenesis protein CcmH
MQLISVPLDVKNSCFKTVKFSAYLFFLMFFFSPLAFSATDFF